MTPLIPVEAHTRASQIQDAEARWSRRSATDWHRSTSQLGHDILTEYTEMLEILTAARDQLAADLADYDRHPSRMGLGQASTPLGIRVDL